VEIYLSDWRDVVDVWSRFDPVLAKSCTEKDEYSQDLSDVDS
jgi:hypothetical protein